MINIKRCLVLFILALTAPAAHAGSSPSAQWSDEHANRLPATDANLITGADVSGSISGPELTLQIEGIAKAIQSDEVLGAIAHGQRGRIGFAVFLWADGVKHMMAPWRVIGSADDAKNVAAELMANLAALTADTPQARALRTHLGSLTDLSAAMEFGGQQLRDAPFSTRSSVLNIIGNGEDNVGQEPYSVRDALKQAGYRINGVVIGADPAVMGYFRQKVSTGFVLPVEASDNLVQVFATKFMLDLVLLETR